MSDLVANAKDILLTLALIWRDGEVRELRGLKVPGYYPGTSYTHSGFYSDFTQMSVDAEKLSNMGAEGVYFTLNPVVDDCLSKSNNRARKARQGDAAGNELIAARRLLLVDFDATRFASNGAKLSGVSSTDGEHTAAIERARQCRDHLLGLGWPDPVILGDSGNGAHLLFKIDLRNDPESDALVGRVLAALGGQFSDDRVSVDSKVSDAPRISKIFGTIVRKGENTPARPHRVARILEWPRDRAKIAQTVSREQLEGLAAFAPVEATRARSGSSVLDAINGVFNLEAWLITHGIETYPKRVFEGGISFTLKKCPFKYDDGTFHPVDKGTMVGQRTGGALFFKCLHAGCEERGYKWEHFRALFDEPWDVLPNLKLIEQSSGPVLIVGDKGAANALLALGHVATYPPRGFWYKKGFNAPLCNRESIIYAGSDGAMPTEIAGEAKSALEGQALTAPLTQRKPIRVRVTCPEGFESWRAAFEKGVIQCQKN